MWEGWQRRRKKPREGKEEEGSLETGRQRRKESWNGWNKTEPGKEMDRQQIGMDRQMGKEDVMTKIRGKTQLA